MNINEVNIERVFEEHYNLIDLEIHNQSIKFYEGRISRKMYFERIEVLMNQYRELERHSNLFDLLDFIKDYSIQTEMSDFRED